MENKNPIQVADRLFLVMEILAETGPVTLAELCSHLDLNKSTVHRLLSSLMYMEYVKQDSETGKYALSFKLLNLSNKLLSHIDILDTVRPCLRKLSAEIGETGALCTVRWSGCCLYLQRRISTKLHPHGVQSGQPHSSVLLWCWKSHDGRYGFHTHSDNLV